MQSGVFNQPARPPSHPVFHTRTVHQLTSLLHHLGYQQQRFTRHVTETARFRTGSSRIVLYHTGLIIPSDTDAAATLQSLAHLYPSVLQAQGGAA